MNLEDELGGERGVRVDELGAGGGKRIVDITRWHTRAALHRDPVTLRHELLDRLRRGGDARLVRPRFGRHSDMPLQSSSRSRFWYGRAQSTAYWQQQSLRATSATV